MTAVQAFVETHQAIIGLLILAAMFVEFIRERYPVAVVSLLGACAFLGTGLLDADGFFSVFSNSAPITIGAMFILSGALLRTGAIDLVARAIVARAKRRPRLAIVEVFGGGLLASGFMNNTPVVVILIPIVFRLAAATGTPIKKLMMPVSVIAILGGCLTLIGTSTNLIVDGLSQDAGMPPFGIFEITPYGAIAALAGCIGLVILSPLLPSDPPSMQAGDAADRSEYLTEVGLLADGGLVGRTIGQSQALKRRSSQIVAVKRGSELIRKDLGDLVLLAGDRLVMRASAVDILTMSRSKGFDLGLGRSAGTVEPSDEFVETLISPTHPSIGGRLAEIPLLNRLRVRVLGISRHDHIPGPDLAGARLRAADRLLISAGPEDLKGLRENPHLLGVSASRSRAFRPDLAPIAVAALGVTILISALDIAPIGIVATIAVGAILMFRCIDPLEAWSSIDGDVLVLIFAMLAVGLGLEQAGSVDLMIGWITPLLEQAPHWLLIFLVYGFTLLLSELLSNNAVAAIVTPIVIGLARDLGVDPRPLVIAVMIAASACFATPIGYQTNALVYAAGDYRFSDFLKVGIPLNIIVGIAACTGILVFYRG